MTRERLRDRLRVEVEKYAAALSYDQALALNAPIVEQHGLAPPDNVDFCQVDVRLLETVRSETENYAHVIVAVNDGRGPGIGPLRIITNETAALVFHSNGRVEKVF